MGPAPILIPGLSVLLGVYGLLFVSPLAVPTTLANENRPSVDAVIPALNEADNIAYAIASLDRQTVRPNTLTVVDDGSDDATADVVAEMRETVELTVELVSYEESGGKTRRIKEVAHSSTAEKLFVLDADTYLEDETYLERVLAAHGRGDVGCAFGAVRPDSRVSRAEFYTRELESSLPADGPTRNSVLPTDDRDRTFRDRLTYRLTQWPVERYRDVLYCIEQSFSKASQMRLFGTSLFPAGCGVLYDRESLCGVFDDFEDPLGDQLTNSEDIFIGFVFVDRDLANVQVDAVTMRTTEPTIDRLRRQSYLWGSAFLQSAYYFRSYSNRLRSWTGDITDEIVVTDATGSNGGSRSEADPPGDGSATDERVGDTDDYETDGGVPLDSRRRVPSVARPTETHSGRGSVPEDSVESEPNADDESGRRIPIGAAVASQVIDGLYSIALFAVVLLVLLDVTRLEVLLAVILVEFGFYFLLVALFTTRRLSVTSLLVAIPVRLVLLPIGAYIYVRVVSDLVRGNRDWMK